MSDVSFAVNLGEGPIDFAFVKEWVVSHFPGAAYRKTFFFSSNVDSHFIHFLAHEEALDFEHDYFTTV